MILTPIAPDALAHVLDRFAGGLSEPLALQAFAQIRATSPERAAGEAAERHRQAALGLAGSLGMGIHSEGCLSPFNWDGNSINGAVEAYVILHEAAHFVLAPPARRGLIEFGLGPGPDTLDRETAEKAVALSLLEREEDEAFSSLLGILWEAVLGQPALASFLDQNWLEGIERSASCHFTSVLRGLCERGLVEADGACAAIVPALAELTRLR